MYFYSKNLNLIKKILLTTSLIFAFIQINPHQIVMAKEVNYDYGKGPTKLVIKQAVNQQAAHISTVNNNTLPQNQELPYYTTYITATAYTSRINETDNSPFTAAWGDHVFWGMIASNAFPKGTKIQIPDYFGDKIFVVLDRMNPRYHYRIDIWMPDLNQAKAWGVKYIKIKVYK